MEPSSINATRNIFEKFSEIRESLHIDDGNTKNRVEEWRKKMQEFTDQIIKQVAQLDLLEINDPKVTEDDSKSKRNHYFDHIVDTISKEVSQIMKTIKYLMHLPMKYFKNRGDDIEISWNMVQNTLENECTQALKAAEDENVNPLEIISKLMNMKDGLIKQVTNALLYRKILLWKDLNIQSEDFVDSKVVEINNQMEELEKNMGYIPTKAILEDLKLDTPGVYTVSSEGDKRFSESIENLHALTLSFFEMENLIKKNFKLSTDKREKFTENNPILETLREQLEELHNQKDRILDDMRRNESLIIGGEKKELLELNLANDTVNRVLKNTQAALTKCRHDLRIMSEAKKSLEDWLKPKLNETKRYQKELAAEVNKIRQDAELLPSMFRAEAQFRNKCKKDKEEAEIKMKEAVDKFEKLALEKKDLQHELERKERLALQAIAARSSMKDSLTDATKSLK